MDLIERSIELAESYYESCANCNIVKYFEYAGNNGFMCTGIIKHPSKATPFDVIRICDTSDDKTHINCQDFTPDEALTFSELLTSTTKFWLLENEKYSHFRNKPKL